MNSGAISKRVWSAVHLNDPTSHRSGFNKAIRHDAHQVQLTGAMLDVPLKTLLSIEQSGCFNVFEERKNSVIECYSKLYDEYRSRERRVIKMSKIQEITWPFTRRYSTTRCNQVRSKYLRQTSNEQHTGK